MQDRLVRLLDRAERSISETTQRLKWQLAIISRMDADEPGVDLARSLVHQLESNLGLFVAHRDQLLRICDGHVQSACRTSH